MIGCTEVLKLARREAWTVSRTHSGHYRLHHELADPDVIMSSTPSCPRSRATDPAPK